MQFAARIRQEREKLKWSQSLLAKKVNVSPALIARIEKGETLPGPENVLRMAREMIIDANGLFKLLDEDRKAQLRPRRGSSVAVLYPKGPPPKPAQLLGEEMVQDRNLKDAVHLLERVFANASNADLVGEILRVFAKEAEQEGSFLAPGPLPPAQQLPKAEREASERIVADEKLRSSYQHLKTCLLNPKVAEPVLRILRIVASTKSSGS